jgi:PAS domain-containing protein
MKALTLTCAIPIMAGGSGWGTVGLNDCVEETCWQPLDVETSRDGGADWVAIAHDQAASALRDSEPRFHGIPEGALDGIVITDDNGVILNFNAAAEAVFGVERRRRAGATRRANPDRGRALRPHRQEVSCHVMPARS